MADPAQDHIDPLSEPVIGIKDRVLEYDCETECALRLHTGNRRQIEKKSLALQLRHFAQIPAGVIEEILILHDPVKGLKLLFKAFGPGLSSDLGQALEVVLVVVNRFTAQSAVIEFPGDSSFLKEVTQRGGLTGQPRGPPSADPVHQLHRSVIGRIFQPGERRLGEYSGIMLVFAVERAAEIHEFLLFRALHAVQGQDRVLYKVGILQDLGKVTKVLRNDILGDHVSVGLFKGLPVRFDRVSAFSVVIPPDRDKIPYVLPDRFHAVFIGLIVPPEEGIHLCPVLRSRIRQPSRDQISGQRGVLRRAGGRVEHCEKMNALLPVHLLLQKPERFILKLRNVEDRFIQIQVRHDRLMPVLGNTAEILAVLLPFVRHSFPASALVGVPHISGGSQILVKKGSALHIVLEILTVHIHADHQGKGLDLGILRIFDIDIHQVSEIPDKFLAALGSPHHRRFTGRVLVLIDGLCQKRDKMQSLFLPDPQKISHRVLPKHPVSQIHIIDLQFFRNILLRPDGSDPPRSVDGGFLLPFPAAKELIVPEKLAGHPVAVIEEIRDFLHGAEILSPDPCVEPAHREIRAPDQVLVDSEYIIRLEIILRPVLDRDQRFQKDQEPKPVPHGRPAQEKGRRIHVFFTVLSRSGEYCKAPLLRLFQMQIIHTFIQFPYRQRLLCIPFPGS